MARIFTERIVPVVSAEHPPQAVRLAEALLAGGLHVIEFALRSPAATQCLEEVRRALPEMLVGAGTVLTVEQLQRAEAAGAQFAIAPGLDEAVVDRAGEMGLAFVPGVMTPTEILRALALGCKLLKFFPAEAAGGVTALRAVAEPFLHTGVKFIATGGIGPANLAAYLAQPMVAAVAGSWLADRQLLAQQDWQKISALAAHAVALASPSKGRS